MNDNLTLEQVTAKLLPKSLTKKIRGQRIIMGRKKSSSSRETFTYGNFEDIHPMSFTFILSIGGHSGAPEQFPPERYEWIEHPTNGLRYEVKAMDLEGNYKDKDSA